MKNNLYKAFYTACLLVISHTVAWATTTNSVVSSPGTSLNYPLLQPPPIAQTWPEIMRDEFNTRSAVIFSDTFGWQSTIHWLHEDDQGKDLDVSYASAFRGAFMRSTRNALRESLIQLPGIFDSKSWIENLLVGTFARTTEESINPVGLTPIAAQTSWLTEMRSNGILLGGFRPLDGYVWGGFRAGHLNAKDPLILGLIRCRYDPILLRSTVDEQLTFMLPRRSMFVVGSSYKLTDMHNGNHEPNWSATLSHSFGASANDDIVFVNVSTNEGVTFAQLGVSWHPHNW